MSDRTLISRRRFLVGSALAVAGGVIAACGPSPSPSPTPTPAQEAAAAPAAAATPCPKGEICIRDTPVKLPTEPVTFRWLDSGDTKAEFWKAFFPKYMEAHPNITVQYDGLPWNEIAKIVPLGIQNGNLHDAFSIPQGITSAQAYAEGWIRPLDDLIPDLEEVKARFPAGSFVEGINVFEGKTYCLPPTSNKRTSTMLLYNTVYLEQAGYDPASQQMTWEDYRAAAKKVTEQGKGQYYGVIIGGNQLNRWGAVVGDLARFAGAASLDDIDLRTGEYAYDSDEYIAAMELLLAIRDDGSFFPGYLSINAPQARALIAQGAAGMILQGLWCLPQWKRENPDFKYGVAHQPVVDPTNVYPLHVSFAGANMMWIYAKSPHPEVAADIFYWWTSLEGQYAWNKVAGVSDPGILPEAMETASTDPTDLRALQLQNDMIRIGPSPLIRNPEVAKVMMEMKAITPNFNEVIQGLMAGELTDVKKEFKALKDRAEAELDRAIKAAQQKGAKVSRDDWVFPNWDPMKDYVESDYQAL
ncbi:MAG: hypothetical protein Kow0047_18560 [Anaerolineae bacterium]